MKTEIYISPDGEIIEIQGATSEYNNSVGWIVIQQDENGVYLNPLICTARESLWPWMSLNNKSIKPTAEQKTVLLMLGIPYD